MTHTPGTTGFAAVEIARNTGPIVIREAALYRVSISLTEPFRISSGEVRQKEAILLRLSDGNSFGWGESSAMGGGFYSSETPDGCLKELLESLVPSVLQNQFASIAELDAHLTGLTSNRFARVAVETAAWELIARRRGIAVDELIGIKPRPIPCGLAVGLYDSEAELLNAIERQRPEQYQRLKIKIKRGHDVNLVRAVRGRFGDIPLFVDANADYTRDDFAIFEQLDDFNLMMFEQPLAKDDLEGSALLQKRVRTPICLDEGLETAALAQKAIEMGSCRIANLKLQRVGGLTEGLRLVEICHNAGIPLWMGTMPELGIGSAQALAVASHPAFQMPTDVEPSRRWYVDDILAPELSLSEGGVISPPPGSGWRYEVDPLKLKQHCLQEWRL